MYSILVVDDERFMRQGIAKILPWRELNIDYVETADSGSSALQRMEEHMPDIVLTDIEMGNMDGLTLIRQMNQLNPRLRIIVLTGHNNFLYVQECCRMEVQDYLLKPVEVEKLTEAIRAQVAELDRLTLEEKRERVRNRATGLAEQRRVEHCFHTFLKKRIGEDKIRRILVDYGWNESEAFQVAVIAPERQGGGNQESLRHELQDISATSVCMELVESQHHGISFRDKKDALVLVLFCGPSHPMGMELVKQVQAVLQNEYDITQHIYMGRTVEQVHQIPDSYLDAIQLRDGQQHRWGEQVQTEQERRHMMIQTELEVQRRIVEQLEDPAQAVKVFEDFCLKLEEAQLSLDVIRRCCYRMLSSVYYSWAEQNDITTGPSITEAMGKIQTAAEGTVYEICRTFLKQLLSSGQSRTEDVIASAKRYIDRHLEEELSVSQLAAKYYLSAAYFSKLFKKTEGVGCNYYIVCQRMERAHQLLTGTNLRISKVAQQVGYHDVNYFSLAFKKYTGVSPAEYRESAQKGGTNE